MAARNWRRIWRDLFKVQWRELQMQNERHLNSIKFHDTDLIKALVPLLVLRRFSPTILIET